MKAAIVKITVDALAKALGLPPHAEIVGAMQGREDCLSRTVTLSIRGVGEETVEGAEIRIMSLCDLVEPPPSLDTMGVTLLHPFTCERIN